MNSWEIEFFESHIRPKKDEEAEDTNIGTYSPRAPQSFHSYWRLWNDTRQTKRKRCEPLLPAQVCPEDGLLWYGRQERLRSMLLIPELEIDNKGAKFMKLAKNENEDRNALNSMNNSEIIEFIQDFHRKFQSLYALYDSLKGEVRRKDQGGEADKEGHVCSTSSSDSVLNDFLDGICGKTNESGSELQKVTIYLKQKLETSDLEVTNLRNKLTSMSEENEALKLQYMASLSSIQESEKIIEGLRIEVEHAERTKEELVDESSQLKKKLEEREKESSYFTTLNELHESEAAARIKEFESQVTSLKLELETLCSQTKEQVQHEATEVKQARDDKFDLESRTEVEKFEDNENCFMSETEKSMAQSENLQMEVDASQTQKDEFEDLVCRSNEASAQVKDITDQLKIDVTSKIADKPRTLNGAANIILIEEQMNFFEMAEEFCKKFEDHLPPLGERIGVAAQSFTDDDNYCDMEIKGRLEEEDADFKEMAATNEDAIRSSKDGSLTKNDMFTRLESMVQRFENCRANFLNQASKVSCEVKFPDDCVKRKCNKIRHVKEDGNCLLAQLDAKEAEIHGFRSRVNELENKVRELEKMVNEKEEGIASMGEEKREAIRQLCLLIDYHRSRSEFLKELLRGKIDRTKRKR